MINYINSLMAEINELTDELYEALMDGEPVQPIVNKLQRILKDLNEQG